MEMNVPEFDLARTLCSGQYFRSQFLDGWHYCVSGETVFRIRQEGEKLFVEGAEQEFIQHFFGLDEPYDLILKSCAVDEYLAHAIKSAYGLRLMRIDPWECMVGFVCSSAAPISKIKMNLELLSKHYGKLIEAFGKQFFLFPELGAMTDENVIRMCKVGFRAPFLVWLNQKMTYQILDQLQSMEFNDARTLLMHYPGISDKIADCILLYGFRKFESFPADVWIFRATKQLYGKEKYSEILKFAPGYFGKYAGYAQLFLYEWARKNAHKL